MIKVKRFTAQWCGPCKQLAPIFEQLQREQPDVIFETIDVDADKDKAIVYGVTSIPTVIIEGNGTNKRFVGVQSKTTYFNTINSLK